MGVSANIHPKCMAKGKCFKKINCIVYAICLPQVAVVFRLLPPLVWRVISFHKWYVLAELCCICDVFQCSVFCSDTRHVELLAFGDCSRHGVCDRGPEAVTGGFFLFSGKEYVENFSPEDSRTPRVASRMSTSVLVP